MSYRAHFLSWALEYQVKRRIGSEFDVAKIRRTLDGIPILQPSGIRVTPAQVNGVPGEWIRAANRTGHETQLLYIHGGAFISCSPRTHRPVTGALALRGFDVFVPDYRLAPEHQFPAGLDDLTLVWQALAEDGPAVIAGDSAGGNLALAVMLRAKTSGVALPRAAALFSPPTDLLGRSPSLVENAAVEVLLEVGTLREIVETYAGETDPGNPLISPIYADLTGLPPLLVHAGEREILRDDSIRLAEKARAAGVEVDLSIYPDVPHAWQLAVGFLPEARESIDAAARFLNAKVVKAET